MAGPIKRSIAIAGHSTSISLEPVFWDALVEAAAEMNLPLSALVARIDVARIDVARIEAAGHEGEKPANLGSAIRVWLFERARGSQS